MQPLKHFSRKLAAKLKRELIRYPKYSGRIQELQKKIDSELHYAISAWQEATGVNEERLTEER